MNHRALSLVPEPADIAGETSSTLKAFAVLEVLVRTGRAVTLSELIQATELPKPTLHRTLALFEEAGILAREAGGRAYIIGERLSRFGLEVLRNDGGATERRTVLRRLASEIGESCNLAVLQRGALTYLDRIEVEWPLRLHPSDELARGHAENLVKALVNALLRERQAASRVSSARRARPAPRSHGAAALYGAHDH